MKTLYIGKVTTFGMVVFAGMIFDLSGKESRESIDSVSRYDRGESVFDQTPSASPKQVLTLDQLLVNPVQPASEVLATLQSLASNKVTRIQVKKLKKLYLVYEKTTYKSRYPANWKYIKGFDFSAKYCHEISNLLFKAEQNLDEKALKKENGENNEE